MKNLQSVLSSVILGATTVTLTTLATTPVQAFTIGNSNSTNNSIFEQTDSINVLGSILEGFQISIEDVDFGNITFANFSQSGFDGQLFNSFYTFTTGENSFDGVFSGFTTTYSDGEKTFTTAGFLTSFTSDGSGMPSEEVPEPLTLFGTAVALGFGTLFKRQASLAAKKQ
ncbi:MAG: PEP-CTERM sorting domain-containing protein [Microcoleaceae cyanobacterium]